DVRVNRNALIAIVGVAAAALLALSFVLGRMSQPSAAPSRLAGMGRTGARPPDVPPPPPAASAASPVSPVSPADRTETRAYSEPVQVAAPQVDAAQAPAPAAADRRAAAADPERAAVAAYFDAVNRIPSTIH